MKKHQVALLLVAVVAMLAAPCGVVLCADAGSSAETTTITSFTDYREQLSDNGEAMYDAMKNLSASSITGTCFIVSVTLADPVLTVGDSKDSVTSYIYEELYRDACQAWNATKLDDPMAFWAWSYDYAAKAITNVSFADPTAYSATVYGVASCQITIQVDSAYYGNGSTLAEKVAAVNDAQSNLSISGTNVTELIKSINSYLCGSTMVYDPYLNTDNQSAYDSTVYGLLVNTVTYNNKAVHFGVCAGFAATYQLLCEKYEVQCKTVYGEGAQSTGMVMHAWNLNIIDGKVYATDTTWNNTGGNSTNFLAVGANTVINGVTFQQSHSPWSPYLGDANMLTAFLIPATNDVAYGITGNGDDNALMAYMPWIIVGLIVLILAGVLYSMARKSH